MDELMRPLAVSHLLLLLLLLQLPELQLLKIQDTRLQPPEASSSLKVLSTNAGALWRNPNSTDMIYPSDDDIAFNLDI